jgi:beta-galactosidase
LRQFSHRFSLDGRLEAVARMTVNGLGNGDLPNRLAEHSLTYRLAPDGALVLENEVTLAQEVEDLPRLGLRLVLPGSLEDVLYLGRGPHENYPDRQAGAPVGCYRTSVREMYVPYVMPQECGHRGEVRWVALSGNGAGLLAAGCPAFGFNALHFSVEDLFAATHTHELADRPEIFLHLDHLHRGLGTRSCGPDTLPAYKIPPGKYRFTFLLRPFSPGKEDPGKLARGLG